MDIVTCTVSVLLGFLRSCIARDMTVHKKTWKED